MNERCMVQPQSYTAIARQYAKDVVTGKILSCKWVQRACEGSVAISVNDNSGHA